MAKRTEWTNGWLCRDGPKGGIRFFPENAPFLMRDFSSDRLMWQRARCEYTFWMPAEWRKLYDLAPPAKGKKFYVSIQL